MKTKETNKKNDNKKVYLVVGIAVLILIIGFVFFRFVVGGEEDSWIKDANGIWVKHGAPAELPSYVLEQQDAMNCAVDKLDAFVGTVSSQCLGTCGNYSVDIVHVPRNSEDNMNANQCQEYASGITSHFIEMDREGNVVRIV